jgi:hypothetical protein
LGGGYFMSEAPKKISFLFGAGAEIGYGLPSGGKFAVDIFKMDPSEDKKEFKRQREKINAGSPYAAYWLPQNYENKPVSSFGKTNYESLIFSSLENRRNEIIDYFEKFDDYAKECADKLYSDYGVDIEKAFKDLTGLSIGDELFNHKIKLSDLLKKGDALFESEYFSAFLKILELKEIEGKQKANIKKIIRAFFELLIGACGEDLVHQLNDGLFEKRPDDIDLFDDLGSIFTLDYRGVGLSGLEIIFTHNDKDLNENSTPIEIMTEFAFKVLEDLFTKALDYQALIDNYFRYLYSPKTDWSKFCKISIFLHTVRRYIKEIAERYEDKILEGDGYYHDLDKLEGNFVIQSIGTTNYNTFIEKITKRKIVYLNGSVELYYDPYLNKIMSREEAENSKHFTVPFLFTQSGIKPLTSVSMSEQYVNLYRNFKESDLVCIIGFGFNKDDGHINGMIRALIEDENKKVCILHYTKENTISRNIEKEYKDKLRIESTNNLIILPVDKNREVNGVKWYEKLLEIFKD